MRIQRIDIHKFKIKHKWIEDRVYQCQHVSVLGRILENIEIDSCCRILNIQKYICAVLFWVLFFRDVSLEKSKENR